MTVITAGFSIVVTALRIEAARMGHGWQNWHADSQRRRNKHSSARQPHGRSPQFTEHPKQILNALRCQRTARTSRDSRTQAARILPPLSEGRTPPAARCTRVLSGDSFQLLPASRSRWVQPHLGGRSEALLWYLGRRIGAGLLGPDAAFVDNVAAEIRLTATRLRARQWIWLILR